MFERLTDGIRASTASAMRLTSLAIATAIALLITTSFLCAAAFISVLQTYGPIQACLAGAGVFFVLTLVAAACYFGYKRKTERRAARATKTAAQGLLTDPMLIATGLQIVRAIGLKRLVPILALGGLALGIMASRAGAADEADPSAEQPAE